MRKSGKYNIILVGSYLSNDSIFSSNGKEDKINQVWFQKYRILNPLGQGGSCDVFLAEHIKLKSLRAIKRIKKDHILYEQLLNEASILKNLRHTCIPVIYDFEEDHQYSYIIEQYIEGQSLSEFKKQSIRAISEDIIINFAIQICDLLEYLYSLDNPILYLDLQPENIIISNNTVKLIDFGTALYKDQVMNRKYSLGTRGYAAPELFGSKTPNERTDIYGVGAILYFMVTGRSYNFPINKRHIRKYKIHCSKGLENIIYQCLSTNPFYRFGNITVLKNKLLELNKKHTFDKSHQSDEPTYIAIAGSQPRIGTTHLSLLVSSYLNQNGIKNIYIERNDSNHINSMINRFKNIKTKDGIYEIKHCSLLPSYKINLPIKLESYKFRIMDYGCLNPNNLDEFLKADIKAIILGTKEWELDEAEAVLRLLHGTKEVKYLFNFIDGCKYAQITRSMEELPCFRIPYEPDPFIKNYNEYLVEFVEALING